MNYQNHYYQPTVYQLSNDRFQRAKDAAYLRGTQEAGPTDFQDVLCFGEKELSWSNAINSMLSLPKKSFKWSTF